ncbi:lipid kinase [Leptolyngbya sp. FACHB-261]|uniref:lipid kinase n=1 Tax=Leptolyngbya sp. FACHB-261 TaxID=2692806 RepID=UPI001689B676|nr:lipid kinase [Leptolyngbya sp. FACHB-261]MBD2103171.1 lipid kinase [Leptolyngbya sp. FACHB-261]
MGQRALLLVNRHARRGQQSLDNAIQQLQKLGFELMEESTAHPQHLSDVVRGYRDKVDLAIIGGGDGTLNAAVDGLVDAGLPLGILPLGTANDLARTLGIPNALNQACNIIAAGRTQKIDLGWVNGTHFFNVASLGLSAQITRQLTKEIKRRWGVLAYAMTAGQVLWQTRPFSALIQINGESTRVRTVQIAIGNGRYYGGGLAVAHDATIDDQRLDLYSLELKHWWQMLPLLPAMSRGRHGNWPNVRTLQAQEIKIYTTRPRPINTDGELLVETPAHFRVVPGALSVFVPDAPTPGLQQSEDETKP